MARVTTVALQEKKKNGERFTMVTAYDYPTASMVDEAGIDTILVGDSLAQVMLGYENTLFVTMDEMIHHTKAVTRAAKNALVVADMPFLSYHISLEETLHNAGRFIQEGGAQAVKLEGGQERVETVRAIVSAEIPVVGHIGLTPQAVHQMGGYKVQGKDIETARKLIDDAKALQEAGVFALVLEGVPAPLGKKITAELSIPTIGIGAGPDCDGQVLVFHDLLGLYKGHVAKFVKQYAQLNGVIVEALKQYKTEVTQGTFPGLEHCYGMEDDVLNKLY